MLVNDRKRDPWNGLSFDEASKGVIACDGEGRGCVLWAVGAHLRFELEECRLFGLGDLGLDDAPAGISIWEGKYIWQSGGWECPEDGEMFPKGTFRAPIDEEWQAIRAGRCPWQETPCVCCSGAIGDYDGPLADCPTHGLKRFREGVAHPAGLLPPYIQSEMVLCDPETGMKWRVESCSGFPSEPQGVVANLVEPGRSRTVACNVLRSWPLGEDWTDEDADEGATDEG